MKQNIKIRRKQIKIIKVSPLEKMQPKTFKICFIHNTYMQQDVAAIFFALAIDRDTKSFFLLCHETKFFPR